MSNSNAAAPTLLPSGLELTVLDGVFRDNPHPRLDRLRSECPVYRDPAIGGIWLTRYEDVRGTLSDRSLWRDPDKAEPGAKLMRSFKGDDKDRTRSGFLFMDDPDHARLRTPISTALNRRVAKSRPAIARIVNETLERLDGRAEFDLIANFAIPIPTDVIATLLGVGAMDLVQFRTWSEAIAKFTHPARTPEETSAMYLARKELYDFLDQTIHQRAIEPAEDLISDLLKLQSEGEPISAVEIRQNCVALLVGGNVTTADLIGNAVWLLLSHPEELAKLRSDRTLISPAIEEVLRLEPPVDSTSRVASKEMTIGGCPIAQGQALHALLQAANRDPEIYQDPHTFNITRKHRPHIAFGGGPHICIGAGLARIEAQTAVLALFDRFPNLRMTDPHAKPIWANLPFFHGLDHLSVTCEP